MDDSATLSSAVHYWCDLHMYMYMHVPVHVNVTPICVVAMVAVKNVNSYMVYMLR